MYIRKFEMRSTLKKNGIMHCALKYINISIKKLKKLTIPSSSLLIQMSLVVLAISGFFLHLEKKRRNYLAWIFGPEKQLHGFLDFPPKLFTDGMKKKEKHSIFGKKLNNFSGNLPSCNISWSLLKHQKRIIIY